MMTNDDSRNEKSSAIYKLIDHLILGYLTSRQYKNSIDAMSTDSMWFRNHHNRPIIVNSTLYDKRLEDIIELFFHYGRFDVPSDFLYLEQQLRQLSNQFTEQLVNYSQANRKKAADRHARFLLNQRHENRIISDLTERNERLGFVSAASSFQRATTTSKQEVSYPASEVLHIRNTINNQQAFYALGASKPEKENPDDVNRRKKAKPHHRENVDMSKIVNHLENICTTKLQKLQNKEINDDWALSGVDELFEQLPIDEEEQIINQIVAQYSELDSATSAESTDVTKTTAGTSSLETMEDLFGNEIKESQVNSSNRQKLQYKVECEMKKINMKVDKCNPHHPTTPSQSKGSNTSNDRHHKNHSERDNHTYKKPKERDQRKERFQKEHDKEKKNYEKRKERIGNYSQDKKSEQRITEQEEIHSFNKEISKKDYRRNDTQEEKESRRHARRLSNASTSSNSTISERSPQKEFHRESPKRVDPAKKDKENSSQGEKKSELLITNEADIKSSLKTKKATSNQQDLYREIFPNASLPNIPKIPKLSIANDFPKVTKPKISEQAMAQNKSKESKNTVSRGLVDISKCNKIPKGTMSDARLAMILAKVEEIKRGQDANKELIFEEDPESEPDTRKRSLEEVQSPHLRTEDRKRRKLEPDEMERVLTQIHGI